MTNGATRVLRVAGITVGSIVVLIILFLLAVWLFINPNDYKGRIEQAVQQSTGRTLALTGDIKLSVFPSIALELGPATLGNPPGFGAEPFASLRHVSLSVRLLPLLHKQLEIGHVEVDGLDLRLKTDAQGRGNWELGGNAAASTAPQAAARGSSALPEMAGLLIDNSRVSYQDEVADHVALKVGRIAPGATVPVGFRLDFKSGPSTRPIALSGKFQLALASDAYRLSGLDLQLDDSTLRGDAAVSRTPTEAISFNLALDHIDLDRYLKASTPPAKTASASHEAPTELPTDSIKTLQMRGNLTVGSAKIEGLTLSQVRVGLRSGQGVLRVEPISAALYGGTATGSLTLDAHAATPVLKLEQSIKGVDVKPLVSDFMHTQRLTGRGNLTLNLTGQGKDSDAILRTLSGRVAANLANGAITGTDIWFEVRRAAALFQHQPLPAGSDQGATRFDTFKASADVASGIATTRDLTVASQDLRLTGQGTANLATEAIDYHLQVTVLKGSAPQNVTAGALLTVPVDVTGTLSNFKVRPNLEALAKQNLQKIEKEQLQKKLPGLLKGLLNGHSPH